MYVTIQISDRMGANLDGSLKKMQKHSTFRWLIYRLFDLRLSYMR